MVLLGGPPGGGPGGNRPPPLPPPNAGPDFIPYTAPADFMIQPSTGLSAIGPPWSQVTAYDLNKGTILWQKPDGDVSSERMIGAPEGIWWPASVFTGDVLVIWGGITSQGSVPTRTGGIYIP